MHPGREAMAVVVVHQEAKEELERVAAEEVAVEASHLFFQRVALAAVLAAFGEPAA